MQTLSSLVAFLRFVLDQQRRSFVPIEDLAQALTAGQGDLFAHYLDLETGRRGSDPATIAPGYGGSQATLNALRPFRKIRPPHVITADGTFDIPGDMAYMLGLFKNEGGVLHQVREVLTTELNDALRSVLYPIAQHSVFTTNENTIQQYPPATYATEIHYLRAPLPVVIKYTVNDGEDVVDDHDADARPPEFYTSYWPEIVARALPYLGVSLSDAEVFNLAKSHDTNR